MTSATKDADPASVVHVAVFDSRVHPNAPRPAGILIVDYSCLTLDLRSYGHEAHTHKHDYHQLVMPVTGRLQMNVDGREGDVTPRQAAVIAASKDHDFAATGPNCFLVADVPAAIAPELERLPAFVPIDAGLARYVNFLHLELSQGARSASSERQMLLLLLQLLNERFGQTIHLDRRIEAARSYLDDHLHQEISRSRLATVANISSRQLGDLFRRQLGMTPMQYLTGKRMQLAWQLLESGALSVQQIAERVGFASLSAFSDRFRKHFGRSPRYFRQIDK